MSSTHRRQTYTTISSRGKKVRLTSKEFKGRSLGAFYPQTYNPRSLVRFGETREGWKKLRKKWLKQRGKEESKHEEKRCKK